MCLYHFCFINFCCKSWKCLKARKSSFIIVILLKIIAYFCFYNQICENICSPPRWNNSYFSLGNMDLLNVRYENRSHQLLLQLTEELNATCGPKRSVFTWQRTLNHHWKRQVQAKARKVKNEKSETYGFAECTLWKSFPSAVAAIDRRAECYIRIDSN